MCDIRERTPLHYCVEASLLSRVKKILTRVEVDVNAKDNRGETPLHLCVAIDNAYITRVLIAKETIDLDIQNHSGETPFSLAIKENKTKMIRVLLPLTKLNVRDHLEERYCIGQRNRTRLTRWQLY